MENCRLIHSLGDIQLCDVGTSKVSYVAADVLTKII